MQSVSTLTGSLSVQLHSHLMEIEEPGGAGVWVKGRGSGRVRDAVQSLLWDDQGRRQQS